MIIDEKKLHNQRRMMRERALGQIQLLREKLDRIEKLVKTEEWTYAVPTTSHMASLVGDLHGTLSNAQAIQAVADNMIDGTDEEWAAFSKE